MPIINSQSFLSSAAVTLNPVPVSGNRRHAEPVSGRHVPINRTGQETGRPLSTAAPAAADAPARAAGNCVGACHCRVPACQHADEPRARACG